MQPILVGIAGGSASGKTSIVRKVKEYLEIQLNLKCEIISTDAYYKPLTEEECKLAFQSEFNFDHPNACDFELAYQQVNFFIQLKQLKGGQTIEVPIYDFVAHQRDKVTRRVEPPEIIFFEGIFSLIDQKLNELQSLCSN